MAGPGRVTSFPPSAALLGNCRLQSALAAVSGCREETRQLQPAQAAVSLQWAAVQGGPRYQWGHHQSINCVSEPGGERGGGPNTRTSSWLSPGLSRNRILAKVIGRKKYQKLSGNNKPSFIAGNIDLAFNSSLIPHSSVCKDH